MNTTQNTNDNFFTIENHKWIENYNKKEIQQEVAAKHHLEARNNIGSEILKRLEKILFQHQETLLLQSKIRNKY